MFIIGEPFADDGTYFIDDMTGFIEDEGNIWWKAPSLEDGWVHEEELVDGPQSEN